MDTRIRVELQVQADPDKLDSILNELKEQISEDGAKNVEIISCEPILSFERGSSAIN